MELLRFDGRTAIVTGAGRGVGRAHARLLAARGAQVVVADLGGQLDGSGASSEPAELVAKEIEAEGGIAVPCSASVATEEGAETIIRTALDTFGSVDVIVNNAGISQPDWFDDLTLDRFRQMIDVHYLGTVNVDAGCLAAPSEQRLRKSRKHVLGGGIRDGPQEHQLRGRQGRCFRLHA